MNENEDFQWEEQQGYADPVAVEQHEERKDDQIKRRLVARYGFADDELKTLFPDRKTLREFYDDSVRSRKLKVKDTDEEDDEDDAVPVDDYELSASEKKEVQDRLRRRAAAKNRKEALLQKRGDAMLKNAGVESETPEQDKRKKKKPAKTKPVKKVEVEEGSEPPKPELEIPPPPKPKKRLKDLLSGDDDAFVEV